MMRAVGAVFALLIASPALAQDPGSRPTREFVTAAAQSDQFEMLEADTVLGQSTDPQVRAYAQMMLQQHAQTKASLAQATARAGLKPPPEGLDGEQARLLGELQSLKGPDLDKAYARHQALAHRAALTVEQGYARDGDTPAVKQVAASATPIIAQHVTMADQLKAKVGAP